MPLANKQKEHEDDNDSRDDNPFSEMKVTQIALDLLSEIHEKTQRAETNETRSEVDTMIEEYKKYRDKALVKGENLLQIITKQNKLLERKLKQIEKDNDLSLIKSSEDTHRFSSSNNSCDKVKKK